MKTTVILFSALFSALFTGNISFAQDTQLTGLAHKNLELYNPAYSVFDSTDRFNLSSSVTHIKSRGGGHKVDLYSFAGSYTKQLGKRTAITALGTVTKIENKHVFKTTQKYRATSIGVNLAHKIRLNEKSDLSIGGSLSFSESMHFQPYYYDYWSFRTSKSRTENNLYGKLGVGSVYSRKDFSIGLSVYRQQNLYKKMADFSEPKKQGNWMFFNITMSKKYTISGNWRGETNLITGGTRSINLNNSFTYKEKVTLGAGVTAIGYYWISPYLFAGYKYKNWEFNASTHLLQRKGEISIIYKLK